MKRGRAADALTNQPAKPGAVASDPPRVYDRFQTLRGFCTRGRAVGKPDVNSRFKAFPLISAVSILLVLLPLTFARSPRLMAAIGHSGPRHLNSCGPLRDQGATYILDNDVSSPNTCFGVGADNMTLNLDGHTVTYAASSQHYATFGASGIACWDPSEKNGEANGAPCGDSFDNFTLAGPGSIVQGPGAAPYSHPVRFGQGLHSGPFIRGVTFTWSAPSSIGIYVNYAGADVPGGGEVSLCTFHNNVTVIRNRHGEEGQSVKFDQSTRLHKPILLMNNTVTGGAQGGLYTLAPGSSIYGNHVAQAATYTNDFGIYVWGTRTDVHDNTVRPSQGRGISIDGITGSTAQSRVYNNAIEVIEKPTNIEYNGCQPGGAYAIQFDDNPVQATAYSNRATSDAADCDGEALRITETESAQKNISHNNIYTAQRIGHARGQAYGMAVAGSRGFTSNADTFVADSANFFVDWDGAENIFCVACTLKKGSNPSPHYTTFSFANGKGVARNIHFQDTKFENGAAKDNTDMQAINPLKWPAFDEYFIDWTYALTVQDEQGNPLPNVTIFVTDAAKHAVFEGTTDAGGKISTVLNEFRMFNNTFEAAKEMHTPHQVTLKKDGCVAKQNEFSITISEPVQQTLVMNCGPKK